MSQVFISYQRSSSSVLAYLIHSQLIARRIDAFIDIHDMTQSGSFPDMLHSQIEACSIFVVLLGSNTLKSEWVQNEIRYAFERRKILLPIFQEDFASPSDPQPEHITALLKNHGVKMFTLQGMFLPEAIEKLIEMIRSQGDIKALVTSPTQINVNLDALLPPSITPIFGRKAEKKLLQEYLDSKDVSIVSLVGFGGMGKSSLVDTFLSSIAPDYGGAQRVFGWHFFSQESQDNVVATSSHFFERALRFFGFNGETPLHDNEKAQELIKLISTQKTILILDGIEPLQHSPKVNQGYLNDKAMQIFLTCLGRDGLPAGGLVVLTSRQPIVEISRFKYARTIELDMLDEEAGIEVLTFLGVRGSPDEMLSTVRDYKGHPLSLVLLGKILVTDYKGDILQRFNVELLDDEIENHVINILKYYSKEWVEHDPERVFMYLVSLFRRPMRESELEELIAKSSIAEPLRQLKQTRFNRTASHLRNSGLLIHEEGFYDTHALIRKYFAVQFREGQNENFIQAHSVLFDYFQNLPKEELPSDLEGLDPLYRAIYHGCMAGKFSASLNIYWNRIIRQRAFFSQKQLGAYSSDLYAISQFFPNGWDAPVQEDLNEEQRAYLLALASFLLTALGRLNEAIKPRRQEIAFLENHADWRAVSADLGNLVRILTPLGRLEQSLEVSERAITAAQQADEKVVFSPYYKDLNIDYLYVSALAQKGNVLHFMGRMDESKNIFETAEKHYGKVLDGMNGYHYCSLLLDILQDRDSLEEVIRRGEHTLMIALDEKHLGDIGNSYLTLAIAYTMHNDSKLARIHFDNAVDILQKANRLDRIPYALIERAKFLHNQWLEKRDIRDSEQRDIDISEAERLIILSNMTLFSVDLNLLKAHILLADDKMKETNQLIRSLITPMIQTSHYRLRLKAVEVIEHQLRL